MEFLFARYRPDYTYKFINFSGLKLKNEKSSGFNKDLRGTRTVFKKCTRIKNKQAIYNTCRNY